jgi:hypothetical protein
MKKWLIRIHSVSYEAIVTLAARPQVRILETRCAHNTNGSSKLGKPDCSVLITTSHIQGFEQLET